MFAIFLLSVLENSQCIRRLKLYASKVSLSADIEVSVRTLHTYNWLFVINILNAIVIEESNILGSDTAHQMCHSPTPFLTLHRPNIESYIVIERLNKR